MNRSFRLTLFFGLILTLNAVSAASIEISTPYSMVIDGNQVRIQNLSDRVLEMRLAIEGRNFISQFPCEVRVFLGPHYEHTLTLEVSAKNKSLPADYRIFVTEFTAKTRAQLISEQKGKPLPVATPLTPDVAAKMQVLTCQSR